MFFSIPLNVSLLLLLSIHNLFIFHKIA